MEAQNVYRNLLLGLIHVGLSLWVYRDIRMRNRSLLWVVGTFLMPEVIFPLYFWNLPPILLWACRDCRRLNRADARTCRRCGRSYAFEETTAKLHGYFEPFDAIVVLLMTILVHRFALYIALLTTKGSEAITEGISIESLAGSHFWIIQLIAGNVMLWLCLHCITVRYRRSLSSVGLSFEIRLHHLVIPLLLAPILFFISEASTQSISWLGQLISSPALTEWIQSEEAQESMHLPKQLGNPTVLLAGFVLLFLMPVGEEILFRGIAHSALSVRFGSGKGILLSALLFAIASGSAIQLIPVFIEGVALAVLYERTRSLLPTIVTRSVMNLIWLVVWFGGG